MLSENYKNINVQAQLKDEKSILNFYKKMITIRKEYKTLIYGSYDLILDEDEKIYAYTRTMGNEKFIVIVKKVQFLVNIFHIKGGNSIVL